MQETTALGFHADVSVQLGYIDRVAIQRNMYRGELFCQTGRSEVIVTACFSREYKRNGVGNFGCADREDTGNRVIISGRVDNGDLPFGLTLPSDSTKSTLDGGKGCRLCSEANLMDEGTAGSSTFRVSG